MLSDIELKNISGETQEVVGKAMELYLAGKLTHEEKLQLIGSAIRFVWDDYKDMATVVVSELLDNPTIPRSRILYDLLTANTSRFNDICSTMPNTLRFGSTVAILEHIVLCYQG